MEALLLVALIILVIVLYNSIKGQIGEVEQRLTVQIHRIKMLMEAPKEAPKEEPKEE